MLMPMKSNNRQNIENITFCLRRDLIIGLAMVVIIEEFLVSLREYSVDSVL
jgi:membrane-bound acyltransferase YfiQ involved in biofilm formation